MSRQRKQPTPDKELRMICNAQTVLLLLLVVVGVFREVSRPEAECVSAGISSSSWSLSEDVYDVPDDELTREEVLDSLEQECFNNGWPPDSPLWAEDYKNCYAAYGLPVPEIET